MLIGYARVSTIDQNSSLQLDALKAAGCGRVFTDVGVNGNAKKRPSLDKALVALKPGDVLTVWKLDRLGRSLSHLIRLINDLAARSIGFSSLSEAIDTTSPQGKLLLHVLGALAEFERSLVIERTRAGLVAARQRGTKVGRKPKLTTDQIEQAKKLIDTGESPSRVARSIGVSPATLYRAIPAAASNRNTYDLFMGEQP